MERGISEQSKQLRRHLLSHNGPDVVDRMQQSGMADPVGMIIEMTDDCQWALKTSQRKALQNQPL